MRTLILVVTGYLADYASIIRSERSTASLMMIGHYGHARLPARSTAHATVAHAPAGRHSVSARLHRCQQN
jgi:hypothetical protein